VESLKSSPLAPNIPGKPEQKTQKGFRPTHKGYESYIRDHARRLFENPRIDADTLERLIEYRGAKESGKTRMRQNQTLSLRAIHDLLNMVYGRGDEMGISGMRIAYRTVQDWYYKWREETKSLQHA
jgi:hypothetical protein